MRSLFRPRRSISGRLVTWVALLEIYLGPLWLPYANAAPPERVVGAGSAAAAVVSGARPRDPSALVERIALKAVTGLAGSESASVKALIDGRAHSGLSGDGPVRFRIAFREPVIPEGVGVFGGAEGDLLLEGYDQKIDLGSGKWKWNRHAVAGSAAVESMTFVWRPRRPDAVLREIEVWGRPSSQRAHAPAVADSLYTGLPAGALAFPAAEAEESISAATAKVPHAGTFSVSLPGEPLTFERAFLVYELQGLSHFTEAPRAINGQGVVGGTSARHAGGGVQVEEISPTGLHAGRNQVQFLPLDGRDPNGYRISRLGIVLMSARGGQGGDASERIWRAMQDDREGTGWELPQGSSEDRDWTFTARTQPRSLRLRLPHRGTGTLTVAADDGSTSKLDLKALAGGWHVIPIERLPPTDRLRFTLAGAGAAVTELQVTGSPLPADEAPHLAIAYPLSGECLDGRVHVRGFLTPPGAEVLLANGRRKVGVSPEGAFAFDMTQKDAGGAAGRPFNISLAADYPNGRRAQRSIAIEGCVDRPQAMRREDGRRRQPREDLAAPFGAVVRPGAATKLAFAGATVEIPKGAVERDVRITIRPLPSAKVAPMDSGMTNVTPSGQAFSLGPHGMVFKRPIRITLPYDRSALPKGYTLQDLRTFYYDEPLRRWKQVGLLDQGDGELVAVTEHFTDFVNATIAMPEAPGTQSFNPTSIKDMKLADPGSGISLIDPPAGTSSGAARLHYPIEVPPGRRGIEPQVELGYSSDGGDGWVGLGWDVRLPSIEVDTRFGVPRYDGSERYLLDGAALTGPDANGRFRLRVEGSFNRIRRLGSDPTSYSWEVTDKNGTKFIYGHSPDGCLSDPSPNRPANIFRWQLQRIEDVHGNRMEVSYFKDQGSNGEAWVQLYPERIDYTSSTLGLDAPYHVDFVRDAGDRPDVQITGRAGFQVLTRFRLEHVDVRMDDTVIRRYGLAYKVGDFQKTLLASVSMSGLNAASKLYEHGFDYHQMQKADGGVPSLFSAPQRWGEVFNGGGGQRGDGGLTRAEQWTAGGGASVGIGLTNFLSVTVGGSGFGGYDKTRLRTLDLTGDSLLDFVDDGGAGSRGFLRDRGTSGKFAFQNVPGVFSESLGGSSSLGWSAEGGVNVGIFTGSASYTRSGTNDDKVVSDVNGDGFEDLVFVKNGKVTARLNDGKGAFAGDSAWGQLSAADVISSRPDLDAASANKRYLVDPLVRWVAPFAGRVTLAGVLQKKDAGGDGVVASIFRNDQLLWRREIAGADVSPCVPAGADGCGGGGIILNVGAGDRLYFLADSIDGVDADDLLWAPTVGYDVSASERALRGPDGAPIYEFSQSSDFRLAGRPALAWSSSSQGHVTISGGVSKQGTADDIKIEVVRRVGATSTTVHTQNIGADVTGLVPVEFSLDVDQTDALQFRVSSESPFDPANLAWRPQVTYETYCRTIPGETNQVCGAVHCGPGPDGGNCTIDGDPTPNVPIPGLVISQKLSPEFLLPQYLPLAAPKSVLAPADGNLSVTGFLLKGTTTKPVTLLVQGVNRLFFKRTFAASATGLFAVSATLNPGGGEQVFFTVASEESPGLAAWSPSLDGVRAPVNVRYRDPGYEPTASGNPTDPMSGGWHRWFFGDWKGDVGFAESGVTFPVDGKDDNTFSFVAPAPEGPPTIGAPAWTGRGTDGYIAAGQMKPSRTAINGGGGGGGGGAGGSLNSLRGATTWNADFAVGATVVGAGVNFGATNSDLDFFDFNGDRLPDSIANGRVRLNTGRGGFEGAMSVPGGFGTIREVAHRSIRFKVGVNGKLIDRTDSEGNTSSLVSTGFNVGLDYGLSGTHIDSVDINGDGLPDQVRQKPGSGNVAVRLNLGDRFGGEIAWPSPSWTQQQLGFRADVIYAIPEFREAVRSDVLRLSDTGTNSGGVGLTIAGNGGGAGVTYTLNRTMVDLIDVNGDGLPDQLMRVPGERNAAGAAILRVKLNLGDRFAAEEQWPIPDWGFNLESQDFVRLFQGSGDTLAFSRGDGWSGSFSVQVCWIVCVGGSGFYARSSNAAQLGFEDIDGDGKVDHVLKQDGSPTVYAKLNQTAKSNLLRSIRRPLGGEVTLDYERTGNHVDLVKSPRVDMPGNRWSLARVTVADGRSNRYTNTFDYSDPKDESDVARQGSGVYDRVEREDYGYEHVTTTRGLLSDGAWLEGDGSSNHQIFHNQDYYRKGFGRKELEKDRDGRLLRGRETEYLDPAQSGPLPPVVGSAFPKEKVRSTLFYEGGTNDENAAPAKWKSEEREFDEDGNVVRLDDFGDEQSAADDLRYRIVYTKENATNITRAVAVRAMTLQNGADGDVLRHRSATYTPGRGTLESLTNYISGGKVPLSGAAYSGAASTHRFTFDAFGNPETSVDPVGYQLRYTYDDRTRTHRTKVEDLSFGYVSTAKPNLLFGIDDEMTDVNGQTTRYAYDDFARLVRVHGPNDLGPSDTPTIEMLYGPSAFPAWAVTKHKDVQRAGDTLDTVTFVDGLARVIQTKKDLERDASGSGTAEVGFSVSGQVVFDTRGRVELQGQPTFDQGAATDFVFVPMRNAAQYAYDSVGRQTALTLSDGALTTTNYFISSPADPASEPAVLARGGTWLGSRVVDPLKNKRLSFADARENRVAVREFNRVGSSTALTPLLTQYQYDPLSELTRVVDAKNNATAAEYDSVGRMVALANPDAGRTEWRFDLSGNLGAKETASLRANGQLIKYEYDFNRLRKIDYPMMADVVYTYGGPTEKGDAQGNRAGRIKHVDMEGGSEDRRYDRLGNVSATSTTLRHLREPHLAPMTFAMTFAYDSFGRMQRMAFPNWMEDNWRILPGEGEVVSYAYDHGGLVDKITGHHSTPNPQQTSHPRDFVYLQHMGYDEFEQRTVLKSGNGIANKYGYDPLRRWMTDVTGDAFGPEERQRGAAPTQFHRMHYTYDLVGNISRIENRVPIVAAQNDSVRTGPLDVTFTYDNLYQIKSAAGKYRSNPSYGYQYANSFSYDEIGNLTKKAQSHDRLVWDNQSTTGLPGSRFDHNIRDTTYTLDYVYQTRPHGAAKVIESLPGMNPPPERVFSYDANGNNAGNLFRNSDRRDHVWDEESRLKDVLDNGGTKAKYLYSDAGERTQRQSAAGTAFYVNQFFVLQPNKLPTKHIFAGETRIATKTDAISYQKPALSFYHPDHLGTTSYVSDQDQALVQHERYFPFGELWRDAEKEETDLGRPNSLRREWLFSSKEWEWETGYYYYGARYYEPRQGQWLSPDPLVAKYLSGAPNSGVYTTSNLSLYSYTWNNPIALRDGDGRCVVTAGGLDCVAPAAQMGAAVEAEIASAVDDGRWGAAALGGLLWFANGANLLYGHAAQMIVAPGNATYRATTAGMNGDWEGAGTNTAEAALLIALAGAGESVAAGRGVAGGFVQSEVRAAASSTLPRIVEGTNNEMVGQAVQLVKGLEGTAAQRADLFQNLASQITNITKGAWQAARGAGTGGSHVFLGDAGQALVIDSSGALFRGSLGNGVGLGAKAGEYAVDFAKLRPL
jgi:RHS repeat-associated protein